jgi:hypothetical protein
MVFVIRAKEGALRASDEAVRRHPLYGLRRLLREDLGEEAAAMDADQGEDLSEGSDTSDQQIQARLSSGIAHRRARPGVMMAAAMAVTLCAAVVYAGNPPDMMPETAIAPAESSEAPPTPAQRHHAHPGPTATPAASESAAAATPAAAAVHHHAPRPNATPIPNLTYEVEPATAGVPLTSDAIAYLQPSTESPQVEQLQSGMLVHVTGSTHYFLQIKLKNGNAAYVLADDASLTVPADKVFRLTSDTPVLARPNKWSKQLSEVHQGHDVHVVGVALNYMRIRMKSGLEGYIAVKALE